jgi:hypothetical protein
MVPRMERDVIRGRTKFLGVLGFLTVLGAIVDLGLDRRRTGIIPLALELAFAGYVWWRGSRSGTVFMGAVLIGLGGVVAIMALSGDTFSVAYRVFLAFYALSWTGAGLLLITSLDIRAYLEHRAGVRRRDVAEDDERWGASRGVQIVGRSCDVCHKRFAAEVDAVVCERCKTPLHDGACIAAHSKQAHSAGSP